MICLVAARRSANVAVASSRQRARWRSAQPLSVVASTNPSDIPRQASVIAGNGGFPRLSGRSAPPGRPCPPLPCLRRAGRARQADGFWESERDAPFMNRPIKFSDGRSLREDRHAARCKRPVWLRVSCQAWRRIWGLSSSADFDGSQAHDPNMSKRRASPESLWGWWLCSGHAFGFLPSRRPWRFLRTVHVGGRVCGHVNSLAQGPYSVRVGCKHLDRRPGLVAVALDVAVPVPVRSCFPRVRRG
jgi:hypothetical protein